MKNEKNQLVPLTEDFDAKALEAVEREIREENCTEYLRKALENIELAEVSQDEGYEQTVKMYEELIQEKSIFDEADRHKSKLAEQGNLSEKIEAEALRMKARSFIRMGEILSIMKKHKGGRPKKTCTDLGTGFPTLEELGITRKLSSEAQKFFAIPKEERERIIEHEPPTKIISTLRSVAKRTSTKKKSPDKVSKRPISNTKLLATYFPQLLIFIESNGAPNTVLEGGVQIQHQGERPYILIPRGTTGSHYKLSLKEAQAACRNLDVIREFIISQSKKEIPHGFRPMKERLMGVFTDDIKRLVSRQVLSEIGGV